jgi:hypothetical protein
MLTAIGLYGTWLLLLNVCVMRSCDASVGHYKWQFVTCNELSLGNNLGKNECACSQE